MTRRKLAATTTSSTTSTTATTTAFPQQYSASSPSSPSKEVNPSILITVIILAIAVILAASLYLLLRFLRRNRHSTTTTSTAVFRHSLSTSSEQSLRQVSPIINALPLFTYNNQRAGDCAVCLSKFENDDVLRLLPVCCHAFHAECIDTWLSANLTCPLCRSPIILSEIDVIGKLSSERSGSFRVEIGNVSNRRGTATSNTDVSGEIRRSYSIGNSFDYIVAGEEDVVAEVAIPMAEYYKETEVTAEQQEALAMEVGSRDGGWLKDYLSYSLYPLTTSFRGSGRMFFTGSSRRSTVEVNTGNGGYEVDDTNRLGDEIHDLFRWLSGN